MGEKSNKLDYTLVPVDKILPIESHSTKRVNNITYKILNEGWTVPVVLYFNKDKNIYHILDGHHRCTVAKNLELKFVPGIVYEDYHSIKIRSLRKDIQFNHDDVINRSLTGEIFPYKTVKHDFENSKYSQFNFKVSELRQ